MSLEIEKTETVEQITIPKAQLLELLQQNEELKADITMFRHCIMKFCAVLGMTNADCTDIKPEIKNGGEGVIGNIIGSVGSIIALFSQASLPVIGKRAEKQIEEKFKFFSEAVPLIDKYGNK